MVRGAILCGVPDVDGDGLDDIACTSPSRELVWVLSGRDGRALIEFAGSANPARCIAGGNEAGKPVVWVRLERSVELRSAQTGERLRSFDAAPMDTKLGAPLALVSDRDGDGVQDLALGEPHWVEDPGGSPGCIVVRSSGSGTELLVIPMRPVSTEFRSYFGDSLLEGPDLGGDGTRELLATGSIGVARHVFVLNGTDGAVVSKERNDRFVWGSFASSIDWRAEWPDLVGPVLLVNEPGDTPAWIEVHSLRDGEAGFRVESMEATGRFGAACRFVDDVDRDGWPDVALGIPGPLKGAALPMGIPLPNAASVAVDTTRGGRVELRSGRTSKILWAASGKQAWDWFGIDLLPLGDVDRDGIADLAVAGESGFDRDDRVPTVTILSGATGKVLGSTRLE